MIIQNIKIKVEQNSSYAARKHFYKFEILFFNLVNDRILEPDLFLINFDRNSSWNLSYDFSSLIRVCLSNINASTSTWCQLYLFQSGKIIEESNHFNDFYPF